MVEAIGGVDRGVGLVPVGDSIPLSGDIFDATISGAVERELLNPYERGVVLAVDALNVPFDMQATLVVADVSQKSGEERAQTIFGFDSGETESAIEATKIDPEYATPNAQLKYLKEDITLTMIAVFKKYGMTHARIAQILELTIREVDRNGQILADLEITIPRSSREIEKRRFNQVIAEEDSKASGHLLPEKELAERYGKNPQDVHDARKSNRMLGRISTPGRQEEARMGNIIKGVIAQYASETDDQILEKLHAMGYGKVTISMVMHRRHESIDQGSVAGKRRNYGDRRSDSALSTVNEAMEKILERIAEAALEAGDKIILHDIQKIYFSTVPRSTLRYVWHLIKERRESEGMLMPELKFKRTRREQV